VQDEIDALAKSWQGHLSPPVVAALELSKRITLIGAVFEQALKAELSELGLTYAEFDVLAALMRGGEPYRMKPSELSRALMLTSGGTSNVLQRLAAVGLVERSKNAEDARSRFVQLTPSGLELASAAMRASVRAHTEAVAGVPEESVRQAADALRGVLSVVGRRRFR
jgi:DNA-binding MarR family transcriptional regulator